MEALWHRLNHPSNIVSLKGYNHFTIAHQLREPASRLTQALLVQMDLS